MAAALLNWDVWTQSVTVPAGNPPPCFILAAILTLAAAVLQFVFDMS